MRGAVIAAEIVVKNGLSGHRETAPRAARCGDAIAVRAEAAAERRSSHRSGLAPRMIACGSLRVHQCGGMAEHRPAGRRYRQSGRKGRLEFEPRSPCLRPDSLPPCFLSWIRPSSAPHFYNPAGMPLVTLEDRVQGGRARGWGTQLAADSRRLTGPGIENWHPNKSHSDRRRLGSSRALAATPGRGSARWDDRMRRPAPERPLGLLPRTRLHALPRLVLQSPNLLCRACFPGALQIGGVPDFWGRSPCELGATLRNPRSVRRRHGIAGRGVERVYDIKVI